MTWNLHFFAAIDAINEAFQASREENDSQFSTDESRIQASAMQEMIPIMLEDSDLLGDGAEELEVSLGGHAAENHEGPTMSYVTMTLRVTKRAEVEVEPPAD